MRKQLYTLILKIIFPFLFLLLFAGCSKKNNNMKMPSTSVYAGKAFVADVPVYVDAVGSLAATGNVNIKSQVTGLIEKLHFTQGSFVKKGDLLISIDPRIYQASLDHDKASLQNDEATLKLKQYLVDKDRKLVKTGAMSKQNFLQLQTELVQAKAQVNMDKANIKTDEINLSYCSIRSPIDGIAGMRLLDAGNIVTANTGPVLVNIRATKPLYVDFTIPEENLTRLRDALNVGKLKVEISTSESSKTGLQEVNAKYSGHLQILDNSVNSSTGTISLRAVVPNDNGKLWPGQFVVVRLVFYIQKKSLLVPYTSVNLGKEGSYLFKIGKDKTVKLINVKAGQRQGSSVVVDSSDIKAGDQVVTVGQLSLYNGAHVTVLNVKQNKNVKSSAKK